MEDPKRDIPGDRKAMYYAGIAIAIVGFLLFGSNFILMPMAASAPPSFSDQGSSMASGAFRGFGGMVLIIIGAIISGIGKRGWSGSGIVIDPQQARRDMEPWSRSTGGMLNDALEEVSILQPQPSEPIVKVRCSSCNHLNTESAKFCEECGASL